jgi:diphthamide synthase (EF-2-diphthine--ammonia ligase)
MDSISEALRKGLREAIATGLCDRLGIKVVVPVWRRPEMSGMLWSLAAERRLSCTS